MIYNIYVVFALGNIIQIKEKEDIYVYTERYKDRRNRHRNKT